MKRNYALAPIASPIYTRFAAGGTCLSTITSDVVVKYYDETDYVSDRTVVASTNPPYTWAHVHPIDGYALNPPTTPTPV